MKKRSPTVRHRAFPPCERSLCAPYSPGAAQSAARTKGTYLTAHFHSIRSRCGTFKAIGATRHDTLIAYWHIVHDDVDYIDLGPDWAVRRQGPEQQLARLVHQIEKLGREVIVTIPAA